MNATGNAFMRNNSRAHAPRHKSKGPVRDGPRSFLSAGSIRYERTLGRLKAAARDKGVHPDTVIMGGRNTFKRWKCDTCGHQCVTSKDYENHLSSRQHMEALEGNSDGEMAAIQAKILEDAIISRLRSARTVSTKATILYEDIQNSAKRARLEDTKWADEADPLTACLEELERDGKILVFREENGLYLKYRPPTAAPVKVTPFQYSDEEIVSRAIKLAQTAEQKQGAVPTIHEDALERSEDAPKISFSLQKKQDAKLGVQALELKQQQQQVEQVVVEPPVLGEEEEEQRRKKKPKLEAVTVESGEEEEEDEESKSKRRSNNSGSSNSRSSGSGSERNSVSKSSVGEKKSAPKSAQIVLKTQTNVKSTVSPHCWLTPRLVVKCLSKATKKVGYYKEKGEVVEVSDYWKVGGSPSADIKMADGVVLSKVPMKDLETVLPAIGRTVIVVQSMDDLIRGQEAELLSIDQEAFACSVLVLTGNRAGAKINGLPYESVCKVNSP